MSPSTDSSHRDAELFLTQEEYRMLSNIAARNNTSLTKMLCSVELPMEDNASGEQRQWNRVHISVSEDFYNAAQACAKKRKTSLKNFLRFLALTILDQGGSDKKDGRRFIIPVSEAEYGSIAEAARAHGIQPAELARQRIFPSGGIQARQQGAGGADPAEDIRRNRVMAVHELFLGLNKKYGEILNKLKEKDNKGEAFSRREAEYILYAIKEMKANTDRCLSQLEANSLAGTSAEGPDSEAQGAKRMQRISITGE